MPTAKQLERARTLFQKNEARDVFYRAALELIDVAERDASARVSVAEALAVLLQTWNRRFYVVQYRGRFPEAHLQAIEGVLAKHDAALHRYRTRSIESIADADQGEVEAVFADFEDVLGPVGAAKALHLLAHRFFPIWDRKIAIAYSCRLGLTGSNGPRYWRFMRLVAEDGQRVGGEEQWGEGLLKRLDEFNYCRYTKGWM